MTTHPNGRTVPAGLTERNGNLNPWRYWADYTSMSKQKVAAPVAVHPEVTVEQVTAVLTTYGGALYVNPTTGATMARSAIGTAPVRGERIALDRRELTGYAAEVTDLTHGVEYLTSDALERLADIATTLVQLDVAGVL